MRSLLSSSVIAALILASMAAAARAQAPAGYSRINNQTITPAVVSSGYERLSGRNNPALNYFAGGRSTAYVPQQRPLPLPPPMPVQTARLGKPFSGVNQATSISPYLALDARETESSLPNYFLYVKPQLDQQRLNEVQQAQYRQLQRQVRTASNPGVATGPVNGGIPTTGHSAQFMNNGGYYPSKK